MVIMFCFHKNSDCIADCCWDVFFFQTRTGYKFRCRWGLISENGASLLGSDTARIDKNIITASCPKEMYTKASFTPLALARTHTHILSLSTRHHLRHTHTHIYTHKLLFPHSHTLTQSEIDLSVCVFEHVCGCVCAVLICIRLSALHLSCMEQ